MENIWYLTYTIEQHVTFLASNMLIVHYNTNDFIMRYDDLYLR